MCCCSRLYLLLLLLLLPPLLLHLLQLLPILLILLLPQQLLSHLLLLFLLILLLLRRGCCIWFYRKAKSRSLIGVISFYTRRVRVYLSTICVCAVRARECGPRRLFQRWLVRSGHVVCEIRTCRIFPQTKVRRIRLSCNDSPICMFSLISTFDRNQHDNFKSLRLPIQTCLVVLQKLDTIWLLRIGQHLWTDTWMQMGVPRRRRVLQFEASTYHEMLFYLTAFFIVYRVHFTCC